MSTIATAIDESVDQTQYLSFIVADEQYAISVLKVKEIIEYDTITQVPKTPRSIRGVINLRGSVVPVVDLALKFGLPEIVVTKQTCVVIVEADLAGQPTVMGVMVDAVSQVVEFQPKDIEEPPTFGTRVNVDYLLGMGKAGKKFVMILNIDDVLSTEELEAAATLQSAGTEEEDAVTPSENEAAPQEVHPAT